ncbi:MAG TPA: flagellar biosynthesis protein FlhA [Anaerolineae bacterium]|nr:flagellar biosynthesis protein FlhA [Anaerolineae bacterium]HIQ06214.1 flagellar biosynthesis protein FlhA [Anaerolineae bacterium]
MTATTVPVTNSSSLARLSRLLQHSDVILAVAVVTVIVMMVVPLPPLLLDVLLTLNISIAITILLISMYVQEPLEFSVFPSLLLIVTLFRLGLNVSASRLILLHAHAGHVIEAFGQFVVGGSYIVGIVVFLLLMVIQFFVITNGAGRVAEVAARFTLDAMPGKQMSIDADMNAGLITEEEARHRRHMIEVEADFYGAMDGASKFVKGDAIAAVVIILVNILGGFAIGVLQLRMSLVEALQTYTLLTVGEGLVTQIPALLISTATGIIVTRAASEANMGQDIMQQMTSNPRALIIVSALLFAFGLVPGLPKLPFFLLGALLGGAGYALRQGVLSREAIEEAKETGPAVRAEPEDVTSLLRVDPLELEIGYGLIPLVDETRGGNLLDRVGAVRRQIAMEMGFVVPKVRIRDNLQLRPNAYAIRLKGEEIARAELMPNLLLAIQGGPAEEPLEGMATTEPVFNLPALWITPDQRERAQVLGYTVVDPPSVISTHLAELIKRHAAELLGRQEVQRLLDSLRDEYPTVVEEVGSDYLSLGQLQQVLRNLVRERVSIRDLVTILEVVTEQARETRDVDVLSEHARRALSRAICNQYRSDDGVLRVITLGPALEQRLADSLQATDQGASLNLEPSLGQRILQQVGKEAEKLVAEGYQPVLLCSARVRLPFRRFSERALPQLAVLSFNEIVPEVEVHAHGMVELSDDAN